MNENSEAAKRENSREQLIERAGRNLAGSLAELAELAATIERQSRAERRRIASDVQSLLEVSEGASREEVSEAIVAVANRYSPELGVSASPSDALVPLSKPVFGTTDQCVGRPGAGVTANFGAVTVSMCVSGSIEGGITGGGFGLTVEY